MSTPNTRKRKHGDTESSSEVTETREMSPSPDTIASMTLPGAIPMDTDNADGELVEPPRKRAKHKHHIYNNNNNSNSTSDDLFVLPGAYKNSDTNNNTNNTSMRGRGRGRGGRGRGKRTHGVSKRMLDRSDALLLQIAQQTKEQEKEMKEKKRIKDGNRIAMAKLNNLETDEQKQFGNILSYQPTMQQIENHYLYFLAKEHWFDTENKTNNKSRIFDAEMVDKLFDKEIVEPVVNIKHKQLRDRSPQLILLEFTRYLEKYVFLCILAQTRSVWFVIILAQAPKNCFVLTFVFDKY